MSTPISAGNRGGLGKLKGMQVCGSDLLQTLGHVGIIAYRVCRDGVGISIGLFWFLCFASVLYLDLCDCTLIVLSCPQ